MDGRKNTEILMGENEKLRIESKTRGKGGNRRGKMSNMESKKTEEWGKEERKGMKTRREKEIRSDGANRKMGKWGKETRRKGKEKGLKERKMKGRV